MMQVLVIFGIFLSLISGNHCQPCSSFISDRELLACGQNIVNPNPTSCAQLTVNGRQCCFRQGRGCVVNARGFNYDISDLQDYGNTVTVPQPPSRGVLQGIVQNIPSGNSLQAQQALGRGVNRGYQQLALQRIFTLGILLGSGGIANIFPRCPVHVKLCYRVPCGGYRDTRGLDDNPGECLKDPTCCFDYELAFLKSIFGPNVMGGAPSCYYGPTSQQWRYITSFFKPWNPWFTNFIVEAFKEVFNTKLFNIGGQVLCQFNFQVKNYPVGARSELECNLVSGCWDGSRPVGKQCTMASSLIKNIFGGIISDDAIYPSLFTDDFEDTRCASNWFNFGARAYRRMECDVKNEPSELAQKITDWCPWQDCCLNYAAFSPTQLAQVSLISSIGGGGTPVGGGILPIAGGLPSLGAGGSIFGNQLGQGGGLTTPANANLLYLLAASSSGSLDLEKLFCPYRNLFASFIDLTETTEGCCDIPKCYHKKQFVGRRTVPTSPPTIPPPIFTGTWGSWGQCNAACGQQGSRTRVCFLNGRQVSPAECAGAGTQACNGPPCQQVTYVWGAWVTSTMCSVTCGGGSMSFTRSCLNNFQQVVSSSFCPGGTSGGSTTSQCNTVSCPTVSYVWGSWTSACTVTCGGGTLRYTRQCLDRFGQAVAANLCEGGADGAIHASMTACNIASCPAVVMTYTWGVWSTTGCSATCGSGNLLYTRQCQNNFGQTVSSSFCQGVVSQTYPCSGTPCQDFYRWYGRFVVSTACRSRRACGLGTQLLVQNCINTRTAEVMAPSLCGANQPTRRRPCFIRLCPIFG